MQFVTTIALIAVSLTALISVYVLHKLTNLRFISPILGICLTLSFILPLSTTYLLPIDAYFSGKENLDIIWRINYWITYLLTWLILPFWQYYLQCGEFNVLNKIKSSLISIFKYLLLLLLLASLLLIYMILTYKANFTFTFFKSLLISTSHIYSLTLSIWLMIHGLIFSIKYFWNKNSYIDKLNNNYLLLPILQDRLSDCKFELNELCNLIKSLNQIAELNNLDIELRDQIIHMFNKIPLEFLNNNTNSNLRDILQNIKINEISLNYLSKIHSNFKYNYWNYLHSKSKFDAIIKKSIYYEDIINYLSEENLLEFEWRTNNLIYPKFIFIYLLPFFNKLLSLFLIIFSIIIIESETFHSTFLSIIPYILTNKSVLSLFIILTILVILSLISLSQIKLFDIYNVEFNSNSDPISTIFFISYSLRIIIPLCYNFTVISNINKITSFGLFFEENLKLIPIGYLLNDIIPRLVIIPLLLSSFGIWGKLKKWLDGYFYVDWLEFDEDEYNNGGDNNGSDNIGSENNNNRVNAGREIVKRYSNSLPLNDIWNENGNESYISKIFNKLKEIPSFRNRNNSFQGFTLSGGIMLDNRSTESAFSGETNVTYDEDNRIINL